MSNASNAFLDGFNSWSQHAPLALACVGAVVLLALAKGVRS